MVETVTIGKTLLKRYGQVFIPQSVYGIVVVGSCLGALDILALVVKRTGYLRPLVYAVGYPQLLAAVWREYLDAVCLCRAHILRHIVQCCCGAALVVKPKLVSCIRLLEHHRVPALVVVLGVCLAVQVPRYGHTAVVVREPHAVTIIPVVEVGAYQSVGVEVERYHHVLASLVNGKHIVAAHHIRQCGFHVGPFVQLFAELLQTVLLGSCHCLAVNGDVAVCLCAVLRAVLRPPQPLVQIVWHFLALRIQVVQVVIVWVAAFVVAQPDRFACGRVEPHHVFDAVHALQPAQTVILQVLEALHRVQHSARNRPFLHALVILHLACGVFPLAACVLHILVVVGQVHRSPVIVLHIIGNDFGKTLVHFGRVGGGITFCHFSRTVILQEDVLLAAVLREHVDVRGYEFVTLGKGLYLEDVDVLAFLCHEFLEVAIVQAISVVAAHFLEAEERGVALVHVEVGLGMEVGVGLVGGIHALLVGAEQGARHAVDAGVHRAFAVVGVLCRGHIVGSHGALHLVEQFHRGSVVRACRVGIVHLDCYGLYPQAAVYHLYLALRCHLLCRLELGECCRVVLKVLLGVEHLNLAALELAFLVLDWAKR